MEFLQRGDGMTDDKELQRGDEMIKVTRINEENRDLFLPAVDTMALAICDILLGAYDTKTNTACGVLAAESEKNPQTGYTLAIRHIYVDESCRMKGVGRALVNALMDISVEVGAKAVLITHVEAEVGEEELSPFFEALDFKRTEDFLPVYGFMLSEIDAGKDNPNVTCIPFKSIEARGWREFIKFADERSVMVNVRSYYDENTSFLAYNKESELTGAILCSRRTGVLFVDRLIVTNVERVGTTEALIYHAVTEAGKLYSPGSEVGITLSGPEQEMLLSELTEFKAEKVGSFVAHVVQ